MIFNKLGARRYGFHLPPRVTAKPALVVFAHGGGLGSPEGGERTTGWSKVADRYRSFVVAYPEGSLGASWNAGNGMLGPAGARQVDDIGFFLAVIDDCAQRFGCDPRRVYLSGFSNGAMLCHWVAMHDPFRVAAFAACSGGISKVPVPEFPRNPVPARIVHGLADRTYPFEGGIAPDPLLKEWNLTSIPATESWWRDTNRGLVEVSTRYEPDLGHEWAKGEAESSWLFFQGHSR